MTEPPSGYSLDAWEDFVPLLRRDERFANVHLVQMRRSWFEYAPDVILVSNALTLPFAHAGQSNPLDALQERAVRESILSDLHHVAFNGDEAGEVYPLRTNDGFLKLADGRDLRALQLILGIERGATVRTVVEKPSELPPYGAIHLRVDFAIRYRISPHR